MKTILHTTISPCENERRIFNEARSAIRHHFNTKIIALKTPQISQYGKLNEIRIERISTRFWKGGPLKFLSFNGKLALRLLRENFDILHAHDLWTLPAAVLAGRIRKKPIVYDAHEYYRGLKIFQNKKLSAHIWTITEKILIRRVHHLITINPFHKELYQQWIPANLPVSVLYNYPDFDESESLEKESDFNRRKSAIIFQGILKPGRGIVAILKALKDLPDIEFWIIGEGEIEDEIREHISRWNLSTRIKWLGVQSWESILQTTRQVRAGMVLFEADSLNYRYAAPNKFFEYVAAGTPVIASRLPTFEQFMEKYEVGRLVNPNDISEIRSAIRELCSDASSWEKYHRNCKRAREEWNWRCQEPQLIQIYKNLLTS